MAVTKPAAGATINTSDSAGIGAIITNCWAMLEGTGSTTVDSASGNTASFVGSTPPTWGSDTTGPYISFGGSVGSWLSLASTVTVPLFSSAHPDYSICWGGHQTAANNKGIVCGDTPGAATYIFMLGGNSIKAQMSGQNCTWSGLSGFTSYYDYVITFHYNGSSYTCTLYIDGTSHGTQTLADSSPAGVIKTIGNGYSDSSYSLNGLLDYVYYFAGTSLTAAQAQALATNYSTPGNPYEFLNSGATGSGAITLSSFSASGAGDNPSTASGSIALATLVTSGTASGTGSASTGSGAITLSPFSVSGAGAFT